jgi:hypothetical protein
VISTLFCFMKLVDTPVHGTALVFLVWWWPKKITVVKDGVNIGPNGSV